MKICHIISNKVWGGGEKYVYDICQNLIRDKYEVELLIRKTTAIHQKVKKLNTPLKKYSFFNLILIKADIIHVHNFKDALKAVIAKKISGSRAKIIVTRHLARPSKTSKLYYWVYRNVEKIIFVSELSKKTFLSSSPKIQKDKICVITNSICQTQSDVSNPNDLPVENLRQSLTPDTMVLMYHGRIAEEKGLEVLVKAVGNLSDIICFHLFLLGTGNNDFIVKLKRIAIDLGISNYITFLGFKDNVMPYVRQVDLGIIPSIVSEACPLSCMEYMSVGKALVTTNNGGQSDYLEDGKNAILISPNNTEELVDGIKKALKNKDNLGKNAKVYFDTNLTFSIFYKKLLTLYNLTLGK